MKQAALRTYYEGGRCRADADQLAKTALPALARSGRISPVRIVNHFYQSAILALLTNVAIAAALGARRRGQSDCAGRPILRF